MIKSVIQFRHQILDYSMNNSRATLQGISTLRFLIIPQVFYLFFWKFSFLDALIRNYIFIKFWEKIPPIFLFHLIFLLELIEKEAFLGFF